MHTNMVTQLAKEHQRDLLREADQERLVQQARRDHPSLGMWLLQHVSAALVAAGRALEPRKPSAAGVAEVAPTLASNDIQL